MDKINVLIVSGPDLYPGAIEEITSVSSLVRVKNGIRQFVVEQRQRGIEWTHTERKNQDSGVANGDESLDSLLAEAEVIFGRFPLSQDMLERAPKLKWVHSSSVGVDYQPMDFTQADVIVTNSRGVPAIPIAEHALMLMFMLAKSGQRLVINKEKKVWERFQTRELRDQTVGLIGLGAIGSEIASLAKGVGMKVIATRRSVLKKEQGVNGVDEIYPLSQLRELLQQSDFVTIAAPLTSETEGMIGEDQLKVMRKTAFIINIARGRIINEGALIKALKESWIAGAGLDVFENEPLSQSNVLWLLPNVIISPHIAGISDRRSYRLVAAFCDNLRRYINKEPMLNIISPGRGY